MPFTLTESFPRLWSLETGKIMVVTDLHGDWDAYCRYRDRFVELHAAGRVDCLVFAGDLIHQEDPDRPDHSLQIVEDVLALGNAYGRAIIYLCGNHELPHIYGIGLSKGSKSFTPAFEAELARSGRRSDIIALFDSLPFYLRTRAGVSLAHAGAAALMADPDHARRIFTWSHQQLLAWADEIMSADRIVTLRRNYAELHHASYELLARHYLAVSGPDDPRYNDLLRGFLASSHPSFNPLLWQALFTRCELEYGLTDYQIFLDAFLQELAADFFPQHVLVAGHVPVKNGYRLVGQRHLRLASACHATPREAGHYLIFDAARPIRTVKELLPGLGSVYV